MTKVSVITISYNSEKTIENTIQSVINQTIKDYEYILVDGNSKDKTLEIAGKYKDFIKKWISEPDKGLYDAMNKGILLAQGEYIIFLNTGNIFAANDTLEKLIPQLDGTDIVYGNIDFYNTESKQHNVKKQNCINKTILCMDTIPIKTEFIKRDLLEQLGGFDIRFKTTSSDEFNLRAILKNNASIKHVNEIITISPINKKIPKDINTQIRHQKEKKYLRKMYFSKWEIHVHKILFKYFRFLLKQIGKFF